MYSPASALLLISAESLSVACAYESCIMCACVQDRGRRERRMAESVLDHLRSTPAFSISDAQGVWTLAGRVLWCLSKPDARPRAFIAWLPRWRFGFMSGNAELWPFQVGKCSAANVHTTARSCVPPVRHEDRRAVFPLSVDSEARKRQILVLWRLRLFVCLIPFVFIGADS